MIYNALLLKKKVWSWGYDGEEADEAWFTGLNDYLATHSGSSLTTDDGQSIVGTTKSVTLSEAVLGTTTHLIRVIGVDQDADNTVTWQTVNCLNETTVFGESAVWIGSTARSLCQSYYDAFPGKASIKTVSKGTCTNQTGSKVGTATYNDETVWLPSESEMGLNSRSSLTYSNSTTSNAECTAGKKFQYSYYTSNSNRIKYYGDSGTGTAYYWERSRGYDYSDYVCFVNVDGSATSINYNFSGGLAPAFVIGNNPYLTFSSPMPFSISVANPGWDGTMEYSTNGATWSEWDGSEILGRRIYLRGTGNTKVTSSSSSYKWTLTGSNIACTGNIETLLDYATVEAGEHPTMAQYCYSNMFYNCTSLTTAPELPATTLANYCYQYMFQGCTNLTTAPALPATTLANYCYRNMFYGCTNLTAAPALPATELANYCYQYMFYGCTNLTTAPDLPATTLASGCYWSMFYNCTSLTTAPELPATTMANDCYQYMFYGCTNLTAAPALPVTTLAQSCYCGMFAGCTSLATAPELPATTLGYACYEGMFEGCTSLTTAPELPITTLQSRCYMSMFRDCTNLTTAPALPATTMESWCYRYMFAGCTSLTTAPELPATMLHYDCYEGMFYGCTSLTTAPALPATTLTTSCYESMFQGCTSLTAAPELPATTLAEWCYVAMFQGCTNLTTAPALPATTLANYCYRNMFYGCTSLTTAPALPATTLANYCYYCMFYGCTNLTTAPELPATTMAQYCYWGMFQGCTGLKFAATQTDEYTQEYRIPTTGEGTTAQYALDNMFTSTGGTFRGTPQINTTYYLHKDCSIAPSN